MSESPPKNFVRQEATAGIIVGILLALAAWVGTGAPGAFLSSHLTVKQAAIARQAVPGAAAVLPTPTATPLPPADCQAPASIVASTGFDPYAILLQKRPDVLQYYRQNGWNPEVQCVAIYDDWTKGGADAKHPTTPAAYVKAQGWAPSAPVATPAPPADCAAPPTEIAQLGYDPYQLLALHRPDVLNLYQLNGWKPDTQCVKLFDNWLQHPDGGAPTTAAAFVVAQGWVNAPTPAAQSTPAVTSSPTPVAVSRLAEPTPTPQERVATPTAAVSNATTYTVQPGDTLAGIALREHVALAALEQANAIGNPDLIQAGQVLRLPSATPTP
ncbi:MAG TPA: LysM peptidoglycan-binding domain-containing protein [Chloroflexota bacterium]